MTPATAKSVAPGNRCPCDDVLKNCHHGLSIGNLRKAAIWRCLPLFLCMAQAGSVCGQEPSSPNAVTADPVLAFKTRDLGQVNEGYVELAWNEIKGTAEYQVIDDQDRIYYRGPQPQAFISGLDDGTFRYLVVAVDADGNILARATEPAIVEVAHWPLAQALALMIVGAIVFVAIAVTITLGALRSRHDGRASRGDRPAEEG